MSEQPITQKQFEAFIHKFPETDQHESMATVPYNFTGEALLLLDHKRGVVEFSTPTRTGTIRGPLPEKCPLTQRSLACFGCVLARFCGVKIITCSYQPQIEKEIDPSGKPFFEP